MFLLLSVSLSVLPDFSLYHTVAQIDSLVHSHSARLPDHFTLSQCPESSSSPSSPPISVVRFTSPHRDLSDVDSPKLRVLFNFGEHGREFISSEVAIRLLETLSSIGANEAPHARLVDYIARNVDLYFIPLLSRWSHEQVEAGHICERKNSNGVDLNRNYDSNFDSSPSSSASETYPGPSAFSEFESRCVRDIGHQLQPHLFINVHSGIRELYYGRDDSSTPVPNESEASRLLSLLNGHACRCSQGVAGAIGGYTVRGGSMDYFYFSLNTTYSYTIELYSGSGPASDCFAFFNPIDPKDYEIITREWTEGLLITLAGLIQEKLRVPFIFPPPDGFKLPTLDSPAVPLSVLLHSASSLVDSFVERGSIENAVEYYHLPALNAQAKRFLIFSGFQHALDPSSTALLERFLHELVEYRRQLRSHSPARIKWRNSFVPLYAAHEFLIIPSMFPSESFVLCYDAELSASQIRIRNSIDSSLHSLLKDYSADIAIQVKTTPKPIDQFPGSLPSIGFVMSSDADRRAISEGLQRKPFEEGNRITEFAGLDSDRFLFPDSIRSVSRSAILLEQFAPRAKMPPFINEATDNDRFPRSAYATRSDGSIMDCQTELTTNPGGMVREIRRITAILAQANHQTPEFGQDQPSQPQLPSHFSGPTSDSLHLLAFLFLLLFISFGAFLFRRSKRSTAGKDRNS